ncbi:MAG: hypothetical protein AAGF99_00410 [Bacteroidota bacterium]
MKETPTQAKARLAMSPLQVTRELILGAFPEEPHAEFAPAHRVIENRYLDYGVTFLNLVAPRGMAKSTIVAGGCALHHLFFEDIHRWMLLPSEYRPPAPKKTRKHVVLISKVQKEAKKRLGTIKHVLEHSERFKELYGDWGPETAKKWTEEQVVLKDGSIITAIGTGQSVRGLNEVGLRPTLAILDDPEDEENTRTVERMDANRKWLLAAVRPALDKKRGRLVVIGTPQNMQSMVVQLHEAFVGGQALHDFERGDEQVKADSVWFQNLPDAVDAFGEPCENRTSVKPGEGIVVDEAAGERIEEDDDGTRWIVRPGLLWLAWLDRDALEEERKLCEKTVGLGVFYREWCCLVVGDAEQVFKPTYFAQTWRGYLELDPRPTGVDHVLVVTHRRGEALDEPERLAVRTSTGIDPAFSTSATADRTAISNVATTHDDQIYELAGVYRRLHTSQLLGAIAQNHEQMRPARGLMEVTGAQDFVAQQLHEHHSIRYIKDRPRVKKKGEGSRIASLETYMRPPAEDRPARFWHLEGSPLKGECLSYPRGKDDKADSTEKAVRCRVRPDSPDVLDEEAEADPFDVWGEAEVDPMVL